MKLIKPLLFAVAIGLAAPLAASAQCKFKTEKKDDFTGEILKTAEVKIGARNYHWRVLLEKSGKDYRLGMQIKWGMHLANGIEKGHTFVYFKLDNGDVLEVNADKYYAVSHGSVSTATSNSTATTQVISVYFPMGKVDKSVIEKLSKHQITAVKCSFGGENRQLAGIKNKQTEKVMDYASCMLKD